MHKYHLVEAELARVLKQTDKAIEYYKISIKGAKENEYIQEEALANELFAKFWLKRNDVEFAQGMFAEIVRPRETILRFSEPRAVLAEDPKKSEHKHTGNGMDPCSRG